MKKRKRNFGGRSEKRRNIEQEVQLNPEGLRKLGLLLEGFGEYCESLGIGMTPDIRMDMQWFADVGYYSADEVAEDQQKVEDLRKKFARSDAQKDAVHERYRKISEVFEKAVSVIFHYAPRASGFTVVPATYHTDYCEGVDSFVVHEKTGQIICAIDETNSNRNNVILGSKLNKAVQLNREGGPIKYGIALNEEDGKWYPSEINREDAPLAYLSMPREKVLEFVEGLARIDITCKEDVEALCDNFFTDLVYSLYQSLHHVMLNIPEQRERFQSLIDLIQEETQLDASISDLV